MDITLQITVKRDEGRTCDVSAVVDAISDLLDGESLDVDDDDGDTSVYVVEAVAIVS